jgi:hypothetical protein
MIQDLRSLGWDLTMLGRRWKSTISSLHTVESLNFAPRETLDFFFEEGLLSDKRVLQKKTGLKVREKVCICKRGSFFVPNPPQRSSLIVQDDVQSFRAVES